MTAVLERRAAAPSGFPQLLGRSSWQLLPAGIRHRFSAVFRAGSTCCYVGEVTAARLSPLGWALAQACRVFGAPLPLFTMPGPAAVTVTDHAGNGGQVWARCYHRRRGFAQCVQSVKRFAGPTGLEEYLGRGLCMPLTLEVRDGALLFRSAGYQLVIGRLRLNLPRWLHPGELAVLHRELPDGRFIFEMTLQHPLFGELVQQRACFTEAGGPTGSARELPHQSGS